VLGVDAHVQLHTTLETDSQLVLGEALGSAPSLPGWRLDTALRTALEHAAVTIFTGRVTTRCAHGHLVESVSLLGDSGMRLIHASTIVLATGKFIGGGITAEPDFVETALGCDVALHRFDRRFTDAAASLLLTAEMRTESQPLLEIGVRTDDEARPVKETGDVVYSNVFVAGSVRAGTTAAALGLGHAATEGWNAGLRAAMHARIAGASAWH
jgi:glycerol-3-phosphate dehydrogenase subunit B